MQSSFTFSLHELSRSEPGPPGPTSGPSEASPSTLICCLGTSGRDIGHGFAVSRGRSEEGLFQLAVRPDERQTSPLGHEGPRLSRLISVSPRSAAPCVSPPHWTTGGRQSGGAFYCRPPDRSGTGVRTSGDQVLPDDCQ
ncbi:uncharacterized protein V6R79_021437 [Siganus canaliculatus]